MSLSLNERFSQLPAPRQGKQSFQVNLDGNVQKTSGGRTIKKQGQTQQKERAPVKKVGVSGSAARAGRRGQAEQRAVSGRQKAIQQRREQPQQQQRIAAPVFLPASVPSFSTPFTLAPVFAQSQQVPVFTQGVSRKKPAASQKKAGTNTNKAGSQKKAGNTQKKGGNTKGNAPPKHQQQNGNARQAGNKPGAAKKNNNGPKKGGAGRGPKPQGPATAAALDAEMDTYMKDVAQ